MPTVHRPMSTIHRLPSTVYHPPHTAHCVPPTAYHSQSTDQSVPPSTVHLSTIHSLPSTVYHLQSTIRSLPSTVYHPPSTVDPLPTTIYHLAATIYCLPSIIILSFKNKPNSNLANLSLSKSEVLWTFNRQPDIYILIYIVFLFLDRYAYKSMDYFSELKIDRFKQICIR